MGRLKRFFKGWKDYLWITLGSVLTAASINIFLVPYKIAPGGISGIATVLYYLSNGILPVGTTMLAMNVPLFLLGMKFIGGRFTIRTLYSAILLSAIIDFTASFSQHIINSNMSLINGTGAAADLLLYSISGGTLMGIGLGIVFRFGATTGGSDLAARITNYFKPNLTMGQIIMFIDTSVIIFASISFRSFQLGLYAIVALFTSSRVIDAILEGVSFAKAVFIISDSADEIAKRIMDELDRGVTGLNGIGMYTGEKKNVLMCILHRGQLPALKQLAKEVDEKSFVFLTDIREVLGEGFKT